MEKRDKKPLNEIRIGFQTRVRNIIKYCTILLKENNFRSLHLSAIGGAIGSLVNAVEVLKLSNPGLYQVNKIGTISYQTVDQRGDVQNQRLYPKLEVTLTLDEPKEVSSEGYQDKLTDDERNALLKFSEERVEDQNRDEWEPIRGMKGDREGGFQRPRGRGRGRARDEGGFERRVRRGRGMFRGDRPTRRFNRGRGSYY